MRHLVRGRKLGRTASHRKATLMALSVALIKSEKIVTTLAKAKALRSYVEPIITRSKEDSTHNRGLVFRHLRDKQATSRLFDEIAQLVEDRPGGYTRIIKLGPRKGDGAEMALIEIVDFNDAKPEVPGRKKRRTRRGGAGGSKADAGKADAGRAVVPTKQESEKITGVAAVSEDNLTKEKEKEFQGKEQDLPEEKVSLDEAAPSDETASQTDEAEPSDEKEIVSDVDVDEQKEMEGSQPEDTSKADPAVSEGEKNMDQDVKDQNEEKKSDDPDDPEKIVKE